MNDNGQHSLARQQKQNTKKYKKLLRSRLMSVRKNSNDRSNTQLTSLLQLIVSRTLPNAATRESILLSSTSMYSYYRVFTINEAILYRKYMDQNCVQVRNVFCNRAMYTLERNTHKNL